MSTTTQRGDNFRDTVRDLLESAGFRCHTEVRIEFKKVDIVAIRRDSLDGNQTIFIETKNYSKNITMKEINEFKNEYATLIEKGKGDRAWLISAGGISPDARLYIESLINLKCFTYSELQSRLFDMSDYIDNIISTYERECIESYFIQSHTEENVEVMSVVRSWLEESGAEPLAIMGAYGIGKTTFAKYISAILAKKSLGDINGRLPILIPLGEIFDDQTIDGLVGKVLASQNRVGNYHFRLFEKLNASGKFLIIFDGFDEMKHGLTISQFDRNLNEIMKLDQGDAKIIILGRTTVLQNDIEFRSIIQGRKQTKSGLLARNRSRRSLRSVIIREFTIAEAHKFVHAYFPVKAKESAVANNTNVEPKWIASRTHELLDGSLDTLLLRPVHAQMLCEIATQPDISLSKISKFQLYDIFIHYMLDREVQKRGRYSGFDIETRRKFNVNLAVWLWKRGGASNTSFADIPDVLCQSVIQGINHPFDNVSLRRELVAGCLADKGEQTIYFSHRSIQEFLVSEYIASNEPILLGPPYKIADEATFTNLSNLLNPEIIEFVSLSLSYTNKIANVLNTWLPRLRNMNLNPIPLNGMKLICALIWHDSRKVYPWQSPFDLWLSHFVEFGQVGVNIEMSKIKWATDILDTSFDMGEKFNLSTILYWAYSIKNDKQNSNKILSILVSRMIEPNQLTVMLDIAKKLSDEPVRKRNYKLITDQCPSTFRLIFECTNMPSDLTIKSRLFFNINHLIKILSEIINLSLELNPALDGIVFGNKWADCTIEDIINSATEYSDNQKSTKEFFLNEKYRNIIQEALGKK